MDPTHFDALARRLASRRALILSLGGLLLPAAAAAAPKHTHKKKCKHGTRRCRGQCLLERAQQSRLAKDWLTPGSNSGGRFAG